MGKIYKSLTLKPSIYIYQITLALLSKSTFLYLFTIVLYKKDSSGASSSAVVLFGLVAVSLSGIVAPFLLRQYKGHILGLLLTSSSIAIELLGLLGQYEIWSVYVLISLLFLIQGIESANYNYEVTTVLTIGSAIQVRTNNTYHILVELFSMVAPVIGYFLINYTNMVYAIMFVVVVQMVPGYAWLMLREFESPTDTAAQKNKVSILKTYRDVLQNKGVIFLNLVRTFNGFIFNIWGITVPLLIATISRNSNSHVSYLQTTYEVLGSVTFIIAGSLFGRFLRNQRLLSIFYRAVPFAGMIAIGVALITKHQFSLYFATAIIGISIYFFRVGTATIGQTITDKSLIAESIVLGDVFSRFVNFLTTSVFFVLLNFFNYETIVLFFTVLGTIGNMIFVGLPLHNYGKLLTRKEKWDLR